MYKPLEVLLLEESSPRNPCGLHESLAAMRLPKDRQGIFTFADDLRLAGKLILAGSDHAKFQRGLIVYIKLKMQVGFMIEFETYRHGVECLSTSSSMHNELKDLRGEALSAQKQADLPEKVYTRIAMISYQALRSMYKARRSHRHPDWQIFCDFIEELPYFDTLIVPEADKNLT